MKIQQMKENGNQIWSTEDLVLFGNWLIKNKEHGYGMLCIMGSCLGIKVSSLLKLIWADLIDPVFDVPHLDLHYKEGKFKNVLLSHYIQRLIETIYLNNLDDNENYLDYKKPVFINCKIGKTLTTSSLNRELQKFYFQYKNFVLENTGMELEFQTIKTNTFEIAWGRDMVQKYNCTKKVFIAVSKFMGHRTVNDTIKLLQIEPSDEIILRQDLFNPSVEQERQLEELLDNKDKLKSYLTSRIKPSMQFLDEDLKIIASSKGKD